MSPPLAFVDTHVHFWDLTSSTLSYDWLAPDAVHPILGNLDGIKSLRYEAEHLYAEARFAGLTKAVHVQAAVGTKDPVAETLWLEGMVQRQGLPHGIIAHVDLAATDAAAVIARHAESPRFRGVRDFATEGYLVDSESAPGLEAGLRLLGEGQLVCDLDCAWQNMSAARDLARRHPDVSFVLEHIGYPRERTPEYFTAWAAGITALAQAQNVHCKISGLGMTDTLFTLASVQPWVRHCVETFGPSRCVFGSNWPVDRLYSSYDAIIGTYAACIADLTEGEQTAMFSTNAEQLYRI